MTEINDPRLVWVPESQFLAANGIVMVYRNRWFAAHPDTGDVLFFHVGLRKGKVASLAEASPQCHGNEEIAKAMLRHYPWAILRFVPLLLKPINVRDYA